MNRLLSLKRYLGLPMDASSTGAGVDNLIFGVHVLMLLLFVGWLGYFILVLIKFNHRAHPKADHAGVKNHSSTYLEGLVALIEAVLLIGLALPLWAHAVEGFPKGAKPGDLPFEQPIKIHLAINRKAAKLLRLKIPPDLLLLADEVIE